MYEWLYEAGPEPEIPYGSVSQNKHFIVVDFWCIFLRFNYFVCDKIASRANCLCDGSAPQKKQKKKKWRYREWNENPLSIYVCRLQLYNGKRTAKKNTKVVEMMAEQQQQQKKKTSQTNTEDNPLNGQPNDNCCAQWN